MKMTNLKPVVLNSALMFCEAVKLAKEMKDGKPHNVIVILSEYHDDTYGKCEWLSAVVDNTRVLGGELGGEIQTRLHECTVLAPKKEGV